MALYRSSVTADLLLWCSCCKKIRLVDISVAFKLGHSLCLHAWTEFHICTLRRKGGGRRGGEGKIAHLHTFGGRGGEGGKIACCGGDGQILHLHTGGATAHLYTNLMYNTLQYVWAQAFFNS